MVSGARQLLSGLCGCRAVGGCLPPALSGRVGAWAGGARAGPRCFLSSGGVFSDWQDPEFMRDVEAATGVDLGSARAGRRGRGKRRRHPGLTDLKQRADTSRTRIAKKVFAK